MWGPGVDVSQGRYVTTLCTHVSGQVVVTWKEMVGGVVDEMEPSSTFVTYQLRGIGWSSAVRAVPYSIYTVHMHLK